MDKVLASVKRSRARLPLRPREELIKELEERLREARDAAGADPGSVPDFVVPAAERALRDLRDASGEEDLVRRVAEWVRFTVRDGNPGRKDFMTRLGSVVLSADFGGPREGADHDWRTVPNNPHGIECARCGAAGLKSETGPVTTHGCDEFRRTREGREEEG